MRLQTGNRVLDTALAGGLPSGFALLAHSEEGAGATEFAMSVLKAVVASGRARKALFVSALRSPERAQREAAALFEDEKIASAIEFHGLPRDGALRAPLWSLEHLKEGDVLVVESADALAPPADPGALLGFWQDLADHAESQGVLAILLHAAGTLPHWVESALAERSDGLIRFTWRDAGPTRHRLLTVAKVRGLAPVVDADQVPVFEVGLHRGAGFSVSDVRSVL